MLAVVDSKKNRVLFILLNSIRMHVESPQTAYTTRYKVNSCSLFLAIVSAAVDYSSCTLIMCGRGSYFCALLNISVSSYGLGPDDCICIYIIIIIYIFIIIDLNKC